MSDDHILDIGLCFDTKFIPAIEPLLKSIARSNEMLVIRLWVICYPDVSKEARLSILLTARARGMTLTILDTDHAEVECLPGLTHPSLRHVTNATYLRLILPGLVPKFVTRLVYLDTDVLCNGSLEPLMTMPLHGSAVAAVRDAFTRRLCDFAGGLPLLDTARMNPQADYFNAGVLVIDVEAWKARNATERAFQYLSDQDGKTRMADQDALNFVFYDDWLRLPNRWNYMMADRLMGGASDLSHLRIIHFCGSPKPWQHEDPQSSSYLVYRLITSRSDRLKDEVQS